MRSARTRDKLLRATIHCLYELGYDRTSTVLVTERAGVSRGAMLHQFPSKADLMMGVAQRIREERVEAHKAALRSVSDPRERLRRLIDISWSELCKPNGVARIEIMLASRSHDDFGARFAKLNAEFEDRHKSWVWKLAQRVGVKDRAKVDAICHLYAAALRGLAIDALQPASRQHVQAAVEMLKGYQDRMFDELIAEAERSAAA